MAFHLRHPRHLQHDHIEAISQLPAVEQKYIVRKLLAAAVTECLYNLELFGESGHDLLRSAPALQWYAKALTGRIVETVMNNYDWISAQILPAETSISLGGRKGCDGADDEDWILKKESDTRWFYVDQISGRMSWCKPPPEQLGGKTRTRQILEMISSLSSASLVAAPSTADSGTRSRVAPRDGLRLTIREAIRLVQQETVSRKIRPTCIHPSSPSCRSYRSKLLTCHPAAQMHALYLGLCSWAIMALIVHALLQWAPVCTTLWVCWMVVQALDGVWPPSGPLQWLVHYGATLPISS